MIVCWGLSGVRYTLVGQPSLTIDLFCRLRLMFHEATLSPTSVSICTTNRMSGEALSNKCFIKPKAMIECNIQIETAECCAAQLTCTRCRRVE